MTERDEEISSALPRDLDTLPRLDGFRLRGLEMTRLEGFVDATFAFAVTMLIIAGQQVPEDVATLLSAFKNVPAFAASIAVLCIFWRGHWLWSRRFGLEDGVSISISWVMIFTMLIYVYPLKLLFNGMFAYLTGAFVGSRIAARTLSDARALFAVYAIGFTALALEMLLLNVRAWRLRKALRLDERECLMTRGEISGWSLPVCIGLIALVMALTVPAEWLAWSGWIYFSMALLVPLHRRLRRRRLAKSPSLQSASRVL
jgi:uncharacterized membrane protein